MTVGRDTTNTVPAPPPMDPIAHEERIAAVDILRGLAIFGILTVNVYLFGHPWFRDYEDYLRVVCAGSRPRPVDQAVYLVVAFLFQDTLYHLFAFLFAFGMAVLMARAAAAGVPFVRLYVRRLLVLLGIGACHVIFLWAGDILHAYALLGFVLLAFRKRADSTLIIWAVIFLSIEAIGFAGLVGLTGPKHAAAPGVASPPATAPSNPSSAPVQTTTAATATATRSAEPSYAAQFDAWTRKTSDIYARGTYGQILVLRLFDWLSWAQVLVSFEYLRILGMFLLGLWAGRRGVLRDVPAHLGLIQKVAIGGLAAGIVGSLAAILGRWPIHNLAAPFTWSGVIAFAGDCVRIPALCLALAAAIVLLVQNDAWRRRLLPLAAVGRMSLTNYLLQSVVCTFIFYGYGLGLYGRVDPAAGLALAVIIFAAQVPLSVIWLRHLRFGPVEWLWRTLTYGRLQPMRR